MERAHMRCTYYKGQKPKLKQHHKSRGNRKRRGRLARGKPSPLEADTKTSSPKTYRSEDRAQSRPATPMCRHEGTKMS